MQALMKIWEFLKSPGPMATIAIGSFIFGIYATVFYEKKPAINFEVTSNSNVYDIHENVGKLDVIYAGQSLRANNQILRLINFRIINSGQTSFLKNDYDDSELLGFAVNGGTILEPPKFSGSNEYLQAHAKPTVISSTEIRIPPLIFEAGEFIDVHVLVLAHEGANPIIQPLGKIAGIKKIQVVALNEAKEQRSFWKRVVDADSIYVQIIRIPIYMFFGAVALVLLVVFIVLLSIPIESFIRFKRTRERNSEIKTYSQGRPLTVAERHIFDLYVEDGVDGVVRLSKVLDRISNRNDFISKVGNMLNESEIRKILQSAYPLRQDRIEDLENKGLAKRIGSEIFIEQDLKQALDEFVKYFGISQELVKKRYFSEDIDYHSGQVLKSARMRRSKIIMIDGDWWDD